VLPDEGGRTVLPVGSGATHPLQIVLRKSKSSMAALQTGTVERARLLLEGKEPRDLVTA